jgi:four helix bundle protein
MTAYRYQDLFAWQTASQLSAEVVRLITSSTGASMDWKYRSQILDAASSPASNIAEGFLRFNPGDFGRFLDYAVGSIGETEQRLRDGIKRGYFAESDCCEAFRLSRLCATACIRLKRSQRRR